jgi:hypothetical protein
MLPPVGIQRIVGTLMVTRTQRRLRRLVQDTLPTSVYEGLSGHKRDVVFFWIPKAAGTSIYTVMLKYGCPRNRWRKPTQAFRNRGFITFGHVHVLDLVQAGIVSEEYLQGAFKFAFVRNPFDRLVSLFSYLKKLQLAEMAPAMTFDEFCAAVTERPLDPIGLYNVKGLSQCNPQVDWLLDQRGTLMVDFVGKYERLEDDFAEVCRLIGIPQPDMPHENRSRHAPYRDYYNERTRAAVEKFYRRDLETFGYSF